MSRKAVATMALVAAALLISHFGFFFFRDNFSTHYPLKVLTASAFRAGEIPYWNFHDSGGQPLAGNPGAQTFYPDAVLYVVLPAHVAFNLHFLLHLAAAFLAMRALSRARGVSPGSATFAATTYLLSGLVVSSTASYHFVVVVALVPLAFLAVERRSALLLGITCGLIGLAPEPMIAIGVAIALAILTFRRMRLTALAGAAALALAIASPQLIAFGEIAGELERVFGFSVQTMLNTSLTWTRVGEIFFWPFLGFLNDTGGGALRVRFFSTLFLGVIALPALFRRSRYTLIFAILLFLALGRTNPIVTFAAGQMGALRVFRFPEKLALIFIPALVVLIADFHERSTRKRLWTLVTLLPLIWFAFRALPIDWFAPYRVPPLQSVRVFLRQDPRSGWIPARDEYRLRARHLEPLFGAIAGLRYAVMRSPDRMHSLLSRVVVERFDAAPPALGAKYLRVAGCANAPNALPMAMVVPRVIGARSLDHAVKLFEDPRFDEHAMAIAPLRLHGFVSTGRIQAYSEEGQTIHLDVEGPALVLVNQSYFTSWIAHDGDRELETVPLDIDRLGVMVPAGRHQLSLRFGRRRGLVAAAWLLSSLVLAGALLVEKRNRRTGEIERTPNEQ